MSESMNGFKLAANLAELRTKGYMTRQIEGHVVALFYHNDKVFAVDNRCPHMGFPLDRGTVKDGILTCHWHHARFDLASGGTFDQWADDVPSFPVEVQNDNVYVDVESAMDRVAHQKERLHVGLERSLSLVIGKAVLTLLENDESGVEAFRTGLEFGVRYRRDGWGQGLTMHGCFMNLMPYLSAEDRPRALYHGLSAVAQDSAGHPPRFGVRPLPDDSTDIPTLKRWFRQFIEVRDAEGAERCIISAVRAGADDRQMADMLFAAVTDHRYISTGHPADFTNKAFESLDITGWELAEIVLTSLVPDYASASRMEESNAWRYPIDLIEILATVFEKLPAVLNAGKKQQSSYSPTIPSSNELVPILLADDPQTTVDAMLDALRQGCPVTELARTVAYAAAIRIAQFHTSNEFGDWDTALHTFTFANAIHQGLRRAPSPELARGIFDAAMSIYLDRFLNLPAARLPEANGAANTAETLGQLPTLLDKQQQVNQSAQYVAQYLYHDGTPEDLLAMLGKLLLREDRDFHTIQTIETAFRQYQLLDDDSIAQNHVLTAAIRYLAAHSPTVRSQGQTYQIASRLHHGESLFEGEAT